MWSWIFFVYVSQSYISHNTFNSGAETRIWLSPIKPDINATCKNMKEYYSHQYIFCFRKYSHFSIKIHGLCWRNRLISRFFFKLSVLTFNIVNIDTHIPHSQKVFGVLNNSNGLERTKAQNFEMPWFRYGQCRLKTITFIFTI